jgi:hypothetical protein
VIAKGALDDAPQFAEMNRRGANEGDALQRRRRQIELEQLRRHLYDPVPYGTWRPCRAHGNRSNVGCECSTYTWRST